MSVIFLLSVKFNIYYYHVSDVHSNKNLSLQKIERINYNDIAKYLELDAQLVYLEILFVIYTIIEQSK